MTLQELRDKIIKLGQDAKAVLDVAAGEGRALTADEKTKFDAIDTDREGLIETERRMARQEEIEQRFASGERRTQPTQPGQANPDAQRTSRPTRGKMGGIEGLRTWLLAGSDEDIRPEQREAAHNAGINLDARQIRLQLAPQALRSLKHADVREWEERALSTLNSGSPVDGYYTIAHEMMRPLEEALLAFGGMRVRSTIFRTDTGAALPIPTVNDTSNKGEILAENSLVNQKDVTFNQLTLDAYKYSSKMILVSVELLQDSSVNLADFLGRALGTRIGRITNDHFTTGDGSSKPNGLLNATTASGTQLAAQTPTVAELIAIEHSVDPEYRMNAAWMFSDSMLAEMKKITDASTGRPIWLPSVTGAAPDTILGYPYVINQSMAAAAGSGAGKSIAFGDLSKYLIRDVRNVTLLRLDERFADYHQVAFLAFSRHDGDLLDAGTRPVKHALNKS